MAMARDCAGVSFGCGAITRSTKVAQSRSSSGGGLSVVGFRLTHSSQHEIAEAAGLLVEGARVPAKAVMRDRVRCDLSACRLLAAHRLVGDSKRVALADGGKHGAQHVEVDTALQPGVASKGMAAAASVSSPETIPRSARRSSPRSDRRSARR